MKNVKCYYVAINKIMNDWTTISLSFSETLVSGFADYIINGIRMKKLYDGYMLKSALEMGLSVYVANYLTYQRINAGIVMVQGIASLTSGLLYGGMRSLFGNTGEMNEALNKAETFKDNFVYGTILTMASRILTSSFIHAPLNKTINDLTVNVMNVSSNNGKTTPVPKGTPMISNNAQNPVSGTVSPILSPFVSGPVQLGECVNC
jgi:hypothetical protein